MLCTVLLVLSSTTNTTCISNSKHCIYLSCLREYATIRFSIRFYGNYSKSNYSSRNTLKYSIFSGSPRFCQKSKQSFAFYLMTQQIIESPFLFYHSSILPPLHMLLISVHRPSQEYHSLLQNLSVTS